MITHDILTRNVGGVRQARGVRDVATLEKELKKRSAQDQLDYLRNQIEMRVIGLGWTQFGTRWSSRKDDSVGSLDHLKSLLKDVLAEEKALGRLGQLPTCAAPPPMRVKSYKQLGTPCIDAQELQGQVRASVRPSVRPSARPPARPRRAVYCCQALFNVDELEAKAQLVREQREAAGISDRVEDGQPELPPPFDESLVGKEIEVLWPYKNNGKTVLIWAPGRVAAIADGTFKKNPRCKNLVPADAVLFAWEKDDRFEEKEGQQWRVLDPRRWAKQKHYSWRYSARQLLAERAEKAKEKAQEATARASGAQKRARKR